MTSAIIGGLLIGLAAAWLTLSLGRVAGISGIAASAATTRAPWTLLFLLGLALGGWLGLWITGQAVPRALPTESLGTLIVGGLLVGYGTRLGSGCTSGHGVCGMARLSPRSIAATAVFVGVGMLTASVLAVL